MKPKALSQYGVSPKLIALWQTIGEDLTPIQEAAVKAGLFEGRPMVVIGPTAGGKSAIGEFAASKAAYDGRRAVFAVPLKAIAEEKHREFARRYGGTDVSVCLCTRDRNEQDEAVLGLNFRLAVMTYEKLASLLVQKPALAAELGVVVVDELQMLGDPDRGPGLELMLAKLRSSPTPPQIIGLSAVLDRVEVLASWLDAVVVRETRRPIDLRRGILRSATFRYVEHNSGREGEERLLTHDTETGADASGRLTASLILNAVEQLVTKKKEQVAVFMPTKRECQAAAAELARRISLASADDAIAELKETEESALRDVLMETLSAGVAFHHADLPLEMRDIVERHARAGTIRAVFCTSTLAMGINLPLENVIVVPYVYSPRRRDMTKVEFDNIAGRAGRLGLSKVPGRAIIVEPSEWEGDILFKRLITGPLNALEPGLRHRPMADSVMRVVAMEPGLREAALAKTLLKTWTGAVHWSADMDAFRSDLDSAVLTLEKAGILSRNDGACDLSAVGRIAASGGIAAETAQSFSLWCASRQSAELLPLLVMLTRTEEGAGTYIRATKEERFGRVHVQLLKAMASSRELEDPEVRTAVETATALTEPVVNAVKQCVILLEWLGEKPIREIEENHGVGGGAVQRLGEEMAWLARTLAAMAKASGWAVERVEELRKLSDRLRLGVKEELLDLAECRIPGIGRAALRTLFKAGFETSDAVRTAKSAKVAAAIGKRRADRLAVHFGTGKPMVPTDDSGIDIGVVEGRAAMSARGEVEALAEGEFFVTLLLALARREKEGWVATKLVDNNHDTARRSIGRVADKIAELLERDKEQLLENDGRRNFRLLLKPGQIRVDVRGLKSLHPHIVKEVEDALDL